ncbi:MAG: hypothetical protein JNL92_11390 [Opitutaceae bacterium]|nr:hypothetical protein [Opitutaceae bacterium]
MNLAYVFTVVLVIAGLLTCFVGLWLMSAGLFPRTVDRCADRIGAMPFRCTAVGVACLVPWIAVGVMVGRALPNAPGKLLGAALIVGAILTALFGTAGLALRIGRGMASTRDAAEPWRRVLRGGVVLALTYLSFVLLPLTLVAGLGAFVLSGFGRKPADPVAQATGL